MIMPITENIHLYDADHAFLKTAYNFGFRFVTLSSPYPNGKCSIFAISLISGSLTNFIGTLHRIDDVLKRSEPCRP